MCGVEQKYYREGREECEGIAKIWHQDQKKPEKILRIFYDF